MCKQQYPYTHGPALNRRAVSCQHRSIVHKPCPGRGGREKAVTRSAVPAVLPEGMKRTAPPRGAIAQTLQRAAGPINDVPPGGGLDR